MTELRRINLDGRVVRLVLQDERIKHIASDTGTAVQTIIPLLNEPHAHLDKFDIAGRAPVSDPGLFGAIEATVKDKVNWTADDLGIRMSRALTEAYQAGCRALRTHLDWDSKDVPLAWEVLSDVMTQWKGKITVQRASLSPIDLFDDTEVATCIARRVKDDCGVLGAFIYRHGKETERIKTVFDMAEAFGIDVDFHVDEGLDQDARAIKLIIAETAKRNMAGKVLCGHACSLSICSSKELSRVATDASEAGVAFTIQPTANLFLQDAKPGRMPRLRGLAPAQELRSAGVDIMLGTDNVRDPFVPFGTLDPLQTLRVGWIAGHLEPNAWIDTITKTAARLFSLESPAILEGGPADFILLSGPDLNSALSHPSIPRTVWRAGRKLPQTEKA